MAAMMLSIYILYSLEDTDGLTLLILDYLICIVYRGGGIKKKSSYFSVSATNIKSTKIMILDYLKMLYGKIRTQT